MYPEDRVLIAYLPAPSDFEILKTEGWYRIPEKSAPKGLHAEYYAFYFGRKFGEEKWAIQYYGRQRGNELVKRSDLLPDEQNHPRANQYYYKVVIGPLLKLQQPIISLRWRRITFLHTTWDRFQDAREISDLFIEGDEYVDRVFSALRERGIPVKRNRQLKEGSDLYTVPISILCEDGWLDITVNDLSRRESQEEVLDDIFGEINRLGGAID